MQRLQCPGMNFRIVVRGSISRCHFKNLVTATFQSIFRYASADVTRGHFFVENSLLFRCE